MFWGFVLFFCFLFFVYVLLNVKSVLFQTNQSGVITQFSSILPIVRTLSGETTPGQSGHGGNGNEGVLHISQSFRTTGTSPSDCLVSYPGHSLEESYPSAEMQSVYSIAPVDWGIYDLRRNFQIPSIMTER